MWNRLLPLVAPPEIRSRNSSIELITELSAPNVLSGTICALLGSDKTIEKQATKQDFVNIFKAIFNSHAFKVNF